MGRGFSDHHILPCKVCLVGTLIKRREVVDETRRIRNKKRREYQYREGYARSLENKKVEFDDKNIVEHMWEQVKPAMVESVREVCGLVRVGGRIPKSVRWTIR